MNYQERKPNRLKNYDYSSSGAYFITICTTLRKCMLCDIVGGGALDAPSAELTDVGKIVEKHIIATNNIKNVSVDKYVIMPNHIHLLVLIEGTSKAPSPTNATIPHLVSTLKRFVNKEYGENIFQRSYHDHIIRDKDDYLKIWEYIDTNPSKWRDDCFYTE